MKDQGQGFVLGFIFAMVLSVLLVGLMLPFIESNARYAGYQLAVETMNLPSYGEIQNLAEVCSE